MPGLEELIDASKRGALEDVRVILQDRPELINMRDEHGATALHHAAFGGHRPVAELLVKRGADINAPDSQLARLQQVGRSNTCAKWVASLELSLPTLHMRYAEVTSNGQNDS
jgi:ankyrin repeat protein